MQIVEHLAPLMYATTGYLCAHQLLKTPFCVCYSMS